MSAHVRSEQCLHAQRCVQEYVDGTLVAEEVVVVDEHLAVCPCCAKCYGLEVGVRTVMTGCAPSSVASATTATASRLRPTVA